MDHGGSIFELQKILGHSDVKTTDRYCHFISDYLSEMTTLVYYLMLGIDHTPKVAYNFGV